MKKIGLFGGSFDPIHLAHIKIATYALKELELDEVQFIPTKNNPWKTGCASAQDRCQMIDIALKKSRKNMTVNFVEVNQSHNEKNYTIDTIQKLLQENPKVQYYYIIGMDQANAFNQWKDARIISQLVQLVAFQRGDYQADQKILREYHFIELFNDPIISSSSDVRNGRIELLDKDVLSYITNHGLYLETLIRPRMSKKRWEHTCSVANLAKDIATANGLNERQAYIAAMFHDIAKEMDYEDAYDIMKEQYPEFIVKPVAIWHQWISRYVSEKEYLIEDQIILDAIETHTTASLEISPIGKCIYVADKLDPLRGYDSSKAIELCKKSIDLGFEQSLIDFYEFSKSHKKDIDSCFYEIYNKFALKGEK